MAVSFKVKPSTKPKQLKAGAIGDRITTTEEDTNYVISISKDKVVGTKQDVQKKVAVIPCQQDGFKVALEESVRDKRLEDEAVAAVLKDADKFAERDRDNSANPILVIPTVKEQDQTQDDNKISRQVAVGEAANYDAVSIDDFGMAMLRGMGFVEGEGIGKTNKVFVKPLEPHVRPKGQGLGAGSRRKAKASGNNSGQAEDDEEGIELRSGVKCVIVDGLHKEKYGTVDGLDAENGRAIIRLAIGGKVLSLPESNVKTVSEKEFQRSCKYINKPSADRARLENEKKLVAERTGRTSRDDRSHDSDSKKSHRSSRKSRSRSRSPRSSGISRHSHNRRSPSPHAGRKKESSRSRGVSNEPVRWLHPHLSVRLRSGKHAGLRGTITDVSTPTMCSIQLESGKILYETEASSLVPIQPRRVGDPCMMLSGPNHQVVGVIIELFADGSYAAVQSVADTNILTERLDNLCLYIGSVD